MEKKAGIPVPQNDGTVPAASCSCFSLFYLLCGEGTCQLGSETILLQEGDLCLIKPGGTDSLLRCDPQANFIRIHISPSCWDAVWNELGANRENTFSTIYLDSLFRAGRYAVFHTAEKAELHTVLSLLVAEEQNSQGDRYSSKLKKQLITAILCYLIQESEKIDASAPKAPTASQILLYIKNNRKTATLKSAAAHFRYTPQHFSILVKKVTGKLFLDLLRSQKMEQACFFLANTNYSIKDISSMVGYSSNEQFQRTFKNVVGCPPGDYRKLQNDKNHSRGGTFL